MKLRRLAAGAIAAAMMIGLQACGGGGDSGQPSQSGGGNAVAALTSANFSETVLAAQRAVGSAHIDATLEAAGQSGTLSGDFSGFTDPASLSMDMTMEIAGQTIEMRLVDKVIYLKSPAISSDQSKPWVEVDLNDPANPLSGVLDTANPESLTVYLQAVTSLEDKGTETVDGVATHHYTVTVDTAKALAASPAFTGRKASRVGLPPEITTNVWLNETNLPVKMSVPLGGVGSFEAHFSKYGEPVSVDAPPANQTAPFTVGG